MNHLTYRRRRRRRSEKGQGITEYGACLAFIAVLVAMVFTFTNGTLSGALSSAFSAVVGQIDNLIASGS